MRRQTALLLGLALVAVAATGATVGGPSAPQAGAARLRSFDTCQDFLRYARSHGRALVGPGGLRGYPGPLTALPAPAAESAAADGISGVDFSATNVQEAGVDEPDIVKTDGDTIFAIAQGKLWAVDVSGSKPHRLGSIQLEQGWNHQLLLHGNRLLVLASGGGLIGPVAIERTEMSILPLPSGSVLTEVDVSNPGSMRVVRTMEVDGMYLSARLTGSTARVVLSSFPVVPELVYPGSPGVDTPQEAEKRNRAAIASSRLRNWLPYYRLKERRTGKTKHRALVGCRQVRRPVQFSGLGMLTVLTIDLDKGLEPVDSDGVMTDGQIVYASKDGLYVATQRWLDPIVFGDTTVVPPRLTSEIHKFDTSDPGSTSYRASGEVSGYLLSQFSLSEHEGFLRVASTEAPEWWSPVEGPQPESLVTVLEQQGGKLVQVGRVGGLGKGERIYAVRFLGDKGYVVTFRQVDPLYTLDLSDPDNPRVLGELKIAGYSAYLHPVGEDLLLGVGQDATEEGRVLGTQVSLFDVADLRRPDRLARKTIDKGWSEAEYDHHAFLYWPARELLVIPVQASTPEGPAFAGAVGYAVDRRAGIKLVGTVVHPAPGTEPATELPYTWGAPIRRSIVVGDSLYTVSDLGVKESSLATLDDRAWVAFG